MPPKPPARKARLGRTAALAASWALASALASVVAALLVLDLPWGRRLAVRELNGALANDFAGRIVVEKVGWLTIGGAGGMDARVEAPDGTVVLRAEGAGARIAPLAIARSILFGKGDLRIDVVDAAVESLEVNVDPDRGGALKLASAFAAPPGAPPTAPTATSRPLRLALPRVTVRHAWVHGTPAGAPSLDADLDDLCASLVVAPKSLNVDLRGVRILTRGLLLPNGAEANVRGQVAGSLAMPSKAGGTMDARASFTGSLARIPLALEGAMQGDRVDGALDVPAIAPDRVHALVPSLQPAHPASIHLAAHGPVAAIAVALDAATGAARLRARATVAETAATGHVDVQGVNLHALAPSAPRSELDATADVRALSREGLWSGRYAIAIARGAVADQEVPDVAMKGSFQQTATGARADLATETIALPLGVGGGSATVEAQGSVTDGPSTSVDADARIVLEKLDKSGLGLDSAALEARVHGPTGDPRIAARLDATHLRAAGYAFRELSAAVDGRLSRSDLTLSMTGEGATSSLRARASIDRTAASGTVRVDRAEADIWRDERALHAHVDRVVSAGASLDVEGLVITGAGAPARATVHVRPGVLAVQGDSDGMDLGTLGAVLGLGGTLRRGRVGYVVDMTARDRAVAGSAELDLADACFWHVDGLTGHFDARLKGRDVRAGAHLRAEGVGTIDAEPVRVALGGDVLSAASWRHAWGEIALRARIDLAKAVALAPPNTLPIGGLAGQLSIDGRVMRSSPSEAVPDVTLHLRTSGLHVETRSAPDALGVVQTVVVAPARRTASGVDVALDLDADGPRGAARVAGRLLDARGTVLSLDASSTEVPFAALAGAGPALAKRAMRVPFTAKIAMPSRRLEQLPDALRFDGASGAAEFTMAIEGPAIAPRVALQGRAHGVKIDSRSGAPLDADVRGTYDGAAAELSADVRAGEREVLDASARLDARVAGLLAEAPAWSASAHATMTEFPLRAVPALADRGVHGTASGRVELTGLHQDARARATLDLADLAVRRESYGTVHAQLDYERGVARAALRVAQLAGSASGDAELALRWGSAVAPSLDPGGASRATFQARALRIGFLAPFLQSSVDTLDGRLDADARVELAPGRKPAMRGTMALTDGVVGLAALGQELHAVRARVELTPDGALRLQELSASGTTGKVTAEGSAHLDGAALTAAKVDVTVAKRDAMPVDVQGSDLGSIYGKVSVELGTSADRRAVNVAVDVQSLHVQLPEASTHAAQDLGEPPAHDHVGVYVSPDRFVTLPLDGHQARAARGEVPSGGALTIDVRLEDVAIARGTDVRVELGGELRASAGAKITVRGQVAIHGGRLDVQGKRFEIESGEVTFTGDPSNPEIKVTAGWSAEDGTHVYADYVGPLKTGKVTLRSEPARPQNEIVALIMFGTADGSESTPYAHTTDAGTSAGTAVGGFAAGGLSKGLDKLTGLDVTTKIDTSQANPRPEVEVQVARNVSLELAVVLGTPPPGTNPDTTYATIDWRFHRNWSLQATFGDLGSSIADVVWRRRY